MPFIWRLTSMLYKSPFSLVPVITESDNKRSQNWLCGLPSLRSYLLHISTIPGDITGAWNHGRGIFTKQDWIKPKPYPKVLKTKNHVWMLSQASRIFFKLSTKRIFVPRQGGSHQHPQPSKGSPSMGHGNKVVAIPLQRVHHYVKYQ